MKRALIIAGLAGLACQSYPFVVQDGAKFVATQTDITIDVPSQSDILFVVDNSGSMAPKIQKLKDQAAAFVKALFATGNKFRIGFTTIDQQEPTPDTAAGNCDNPPNPTPGADPLFNGVCGHLLAPAGEAAYLDSANFTSPDDMATAITHYLGSLNTSGSSWEQPIRGAWAALDPANGAPGKPDAGFFRDDALLVILILTDESDCSFQPGNGASLVDPSVGEGDACYVRLDDLVTPQEWAQLIVDRKGGDPRNVAVGVISGAYPDSAGDLEPGDCINVNAPYPGDIAAECYGFIDDPFFDAVSPNGHAGDPQCLAVGNDRLFQFSSQFASLRDSICRTDYSQAMLKLADLADRQCFALNDPPLNGDPSNISVKLERVGDTIFNDVPFTTDQSGQTSGWYYSPAPSAEVCLAGTWKRKKGDTIRYLVLDTQTADTGQPASR